MVSLLPDPVVSADRVPCFRTEAGTAKRRIKHQFAVASDCVGELRIEYSAEKIKHRLQLSLDVAMLQVRVEVDRLPL